MRDNERSILALLIKDLVINREIAGYGTSAKVGYQAWTTMDNHQFFYIGLSFMLLHEMDAIRCREWRIFPGLSLLNDSWGLKVFMAAHLPLFFLLLWSLSDASLINQSIYGLNIFFIVHFVLHLLFLFHKKNEFKDWISWTIISSTTICGIIDLIL